MGPLVTVVVPIYGVERYLSQCLDSVVGQTYRLLDVILVDDGSPDRSGAICDGYADNDTRVRVFHTTNRGLSAARNLGIAMARGEWILFLDGDDWLETRAVETLVGVVLETGADISCCGRVIEWASGPGLKRCPVGAVVLERADALCSLLVGDPVTDCAWAKLYRATLFEGIYYPEGRVYEDIATTYRIVVRAERIACIPDALVHYRMRSSSITKQHSAVNLTDYWWVHRKRYDELTDASEEFRRACIMFCLSAVARTWCWWAAVPRVEREAHRAEIDAMRWFARTHVHEVLCGSYPLGMKARCILGCWATPVVWVPMYAANLLRHAVYNREVYP